LLLLIYKNKMISSKFQSQEELTVSSDDAPMIKAPAKKKVISDLEQGPSDGPEKEFVFAIEGLSSSEADRLLQIYGLNELPDKKTPKWVIFLQQLVQPMRKF